MGGLLLLGGCSLRDDASPTVCILEEIQFTEYSSLKIVTISGGQIYQLRQEYTIDDETQVTSSFKYSYFKDSLAIYDELDGSSIYPYMTVKYYNEKPIRVTRYFPESGVYLYHDLDYSTPNLIRDNMTRIASTGDVWHMGYADYYLDEDGNVIRNERFESNREKVGEFNQYEDREFVYDGFESPQQHLLLPFFNQKTFPDVKFFSSNNIVTTSENEEAQHFRYEYNDEGYIKIMIQPDGTPVYFR